MADIELAIRGGMVVDGTGAPARRADVGIAEGKVVEIAETVRGAEELDARGRLVAPGFLDIHTHYDPQVLWDRALTPSSWHGVTGVVAGNCGYSIAPTRPGDRASLLRTLDKVEDMRVATLEAGVDWDFETYREYLDAVRRRGVAINFGGYVGHTPVRLYVMGDDAYERPATDDEIGRMQEAVADSIHGGALGFSSDRGGFHLGDGGRPVPSIAACQEETEALMGVVGELGFGVVHVAPGENFGWVYEFQPRLGRRLNWSSILTYPRDGSQPGAVPQQAGPPPRRPGGRGRRVGAGHLPAHRAGDLDGGADERSTRWGRSPSWWRCGHAERPRAVSPIAAGASGCRATSTPTG